MTLAYKSLALLLALATLTLGALLAASQLQAFYFYHPHLPVRDTFNFLPLIQQALEIGPLNIPLSQWWQTHAGAHRVVLPRLLMFADYSLLDGRNHLIQMATGASLLTLLALYAALARKLTAGQWVQRVFLIGVSLVFLLSPSQAWNLFLPINSSWYLVLAFSAVSITLLSWTEDGPSPIQITGAYLLGALAGASNFAGTLLLLLIPPVLYLRHSRWTLLSSLITALLFWMYFPNLAPASELAQSSNLSGTFSWQLLREVTVYLGSPLTRAQPTIAAILVAASLLYLAGSWLRKLQVVHRGQYNPDAAELTPLVMASLCFGISLATQMGRSIFSDPDAWRYQTVVMFFWLNMCWLIHAHFRQKLLAMITITAIFTAMVLWPLTQPLPKESRLWASAAATEAAVSKGIPERSIYNTLLPVYGRDYLADHLTFMRNRGLSLYSPQARRPQPCSQRVLGDALSSGSSIGTFYYQLALLCGRGGPQVR